MRRALRSLLFILALVVSACQAMPVATTAPGEVLPALPTPSASATVEPSHIQTPTVPTIPSPQVRIPSTPTTPSAAIEQTPSVSTAPTSAFQVRWHPDGPLYIGDRLSLEVIPKADTNLRGKTLNVVLETAQGEQDLGSSNFDSFGLGNRLQATFWWFWNTAGLDPGDYSLKFTVLPEAQTWQETVTLLPASAQPELEAGAAWRMAESQCCQVHYFSNTAAERDVSALLTKLDEQSASIAEKLGAKTEEKIPVVLLPRVLGHGGFSSDSIAVSYLDRNYAGNGSEMVLHHELVHWLDSKLGGEMRPSLLVEGLAVYLSGGHFKPEPIFQRAAALLPPGEECVISTPEAPLAPLAASCGLNMFISLKELADNFYPSQHEIGYIEAGALIEFMVQRWGWQAFIDFYRDIHPPEQSGEDETQVDDQSKALDIALQKHFDIDLEALEQSFKAALRNEKLTPEVVNDVRLSIDYFETMRRYQELLDPSAYFLFAWLADSTTMRKEGITADFLRHPEKLENIALELMFVTADSDLRNGDIGQATQVLAAIQEALDEFANGSGNPMAANALVEDYATLVQAVERAGYQPQRLEIRENNAWVWVRANEPDLSLLQFARSLQGWQIQETVNALSSESFFLKAGFMGKYTAN